MDANTKPLISVIITTHNVEKYIKEAICSVLEQSIQDFEILIVDDGSSDETINVLESILDKRIKLIKSPVNKGRIKSLNIAFKEAKGKYITIVDGDDINALNRFEKQLEVLENNTRIKVCGCWYEEFGFNNRIIKHYEKHHVIKTKLLLSCSMTFGGSMFERKFVENFVFDEKKKHVEDYDFWARVACLGEFYNIQEVLYYYRIHENQVSTIHNATQKLGDVYIKIYLLKKLNYDTFTYSDTFLEKMLYLKEYFSVKEFGVYLSFLKEILKLNKNKQVFDSFELEKVVKEIKNRLIIKIYFQDSGLGITKEWRINALFKMSIQDVIKIVILKCKEKIKVWIRKYK